MFATTIGNVATAASIIIAVAALIVSWRSNRHAARSAAAADRSAGAADRSAAAEEAAAAIEQRRFDREQEDREAESARREAEEDAVRTAAEREANAARIVLRTERRANQRQTFGNSEPFTYLLIVANTGQRPADRWSIGNLACNGSGDNDMPARASERDALHPSTSLLPNRQVEIPLTSCGPRNCWDLAEAEVTWHDRNGQNRIRQMPIAKNW